MIAIVDYGMGNLRSVQKAFQYIGIEAKITQNPKEIINADKVVLPGVGAFRVAMEKLETLKLVPVLKEILKAGKPYLGICLGLQLLFDESDEFGKIKGLGVLTGKVKKFTPLESKPLIGLTELKVPHMGWNQIKIKNQKSKIIRLRRGYGGCPPKFQTKASKNESISPLLKGIPDNSFMYFCHSYFVVPQDESIITTYTEYGQDFVSMINKDNIVGVQFHPEKSQALGIKILENFNRI